MIERRHLLFTDSGRASSKILEWLQEFTENLVDDEVPEHRDSHASSSHEVSLEPTFRRREDSAQYLYSFLENRNCAICQRTEITVQKTQWRSGTSCWKFWWLVNSRSQGSQWKLRISKQSPICSRGAGLGHPMDPVVSVQSKNFTGNTEACQSFWSPKGSLTSFTLLVSWNLAKLVKIFPGIIIRHHHTDQKQMWLLKEQRAEWKKVPLQYGWKLVGRFQGMWHLSTKRHRSLISWEDAPWKTFRPTI